LEKKEPVTPENLPLGKFVRGPVSAPAKALVQFYPNTVRIPETKFFRNF
jgi:hypothetical protein